MASTLRESIIFLESIGFLNVILPFIFVFVIVFGMLERTKVFGLEGGKTRKNLNAMAAFVIGFLFIASMSQVDSLVFYLQALGMGLIFLTAFLYFVSGMREEAYFTRDTFFNMFLLVIIVIVFFASMGFFNDLPGNFFVDLVINPVVISVVSFFGLIWFIVGGKSVKGKEIKKKDEERVVKDVEEVKKEESEIESKPEPISDYGNFPPPGEIEGSTHRGRIKKEDLEKPGIKFT